MTSTFANARENLSDEQLKQVTGGARINSRPEAPEGHLIDHGTLDLHGAAAEEHPRFQVGAPPEVRLPDPEPTKPVEELQFGEPLRFPGLTDDSGHKVALDRIDEIDLLSNGEVWAVGEVGQHRESVELGNDYGDDHFATSTKVVEIAVWAWGAGPLSQGHRH
jgi:hypothetical protein